MGFDWSQIPEQDRHLLPKMVDIRVDLGEYLGIKHGSGFVVRTSEPEPYLNQFFMHLVWTWVEEARRIYGDDASVEYITKALHKAWAAAAAHAAEKAGPGSPALPAPARASLAGRGDRDDAGADQDPPGSYQAPKITRLT